MIKSSSGLSDEEIEQMVQDAEANAEADKEFEEMIQVRNTADGLVHATKKTLEEAGDKATAEEKEAIDAMPNIEQQLKQDLGIHPKHFSENRLESSVMEPGVIVTGIQVGSTGDKARNVVLPKATASINLRLVANQKTKTVKQLVEKHFESLGYFLISEEATNKLLKQHEKVLYLDWGDSGYPAFRTSLTSPMAKQLSGILTKLDGRKPLMTPTMGGSLPIYLFEQAIEAPIIILPVANHDNNQHGPDENIRIKNLWDAIDVYTAVITEL